MLDNGFGFSANNFFLQVAIDEIPFYNNETKYIYGML